MSLSMEEETEDQRGEIIFLRLHSWQAAEQDLHPGHLTLEPPLIIITKLFVLPLVCLIWLISLLCFWFPLPSHFDHQDDASEQSQFLKNLGQKQQIIGVAETFARRRPTLSLDSTKSLHAW